MAKHGDLWAFGTSPVEAAGRSPEEVRAQRRMLAPISRWVGPGRRSGSGRWHRSCVRVCCASQARELRHDA
eukprot:3926800-Prymnesium_polylepis.1